MALYDKFTKEEREKLAKASLDNFNSTPIGAKMRKKWADCPLPADNTSLDTANQMAIYGSAIWWKNKGMDGKPDAVYPVWRSYMESGDNKTKPSVIPDEMFGEVKTTGVFLSMSRLEAKELLRSIQVNMTAGVDPTHSVVRRFTNLLSKLPLYSTDD